MTERRRYRLIDDIRAVAVINMILYHLCFDIFINFGIWEGFAQDTSAVIWERFICCTFILISGVSLNFSRRGYRRGLIVLLCAAVVTAVTALLTPDFVIRFGILHFLGCAILLTEALRRALNHLAPIPGMAVFFLLFMLCYGIPEGYIGLFSYPLLPLPEALYQSRWFAFIGFRPDDYFSADYFPLLRWIFLYLFGYELWRFVTARGWDRFFTRGIAPLNFIGRHSLIIYMAHQPLLYGVCLLIFR